MTRRGKAATWRKVAFWQMALGLLVWGLLAGFADRLSRGQFIILAVVFCIIVLGPSMVLAFGPARFRSRFPATVAVTARMFALLTGCWLTLVLVSRFVSSHISEGVSTWLIAPLGAGAWVWFWVAPMFGYGRLGRELTEAARQEERDSWRN